MNNNKKFVFLIIIIIIIIIIIEVLILIIIYRLGLTRREDKRISSLSLFKCIDGALSLCKG